MAFKDLSEQATLQLILTGYRFAAFLAMVRGNAFVRLLNLILVLTCDGCRICCR